MTPDWWQWELRVPEAEVEATEAALLALGAEAVTWLEDPEAPAVFVPGSYWPHSTAQALFPGSADWQQRLAALQDQSPWLDYGPRLEAIHEQDWVARTQAEFPARQFGRLWIAPHWAEVPAGALTLRLDPGQAFGTGAHATTALCLEALAERIQGPERVLDYGCGSGILAIAAVLLGATGGGVGVDVDPIALEVAQANAEINGVATALSWQLPEAVDSHQRYPLVVANILAAPLISLASTIGALVAPKGDLLLSGLLHAQEAAVMAAYADAFDFMPPRRREDWSLLWARRKRE